MKLLGFITRVLFLLCWVPVVWAVYCYDGAREAWKKHKLGAAYEGPLDNEDLP